MDERIRALERLARAGDPGAARAWMQEAARLGDMGLHYEAFRVLCTVCMDPLLRQTLELIELSRKNVDNTHCESLLMWYYPILGSAA